MSNHRKNVVPSSKTEKIHNWICLILVVCMIVYTGLEIPRMPDHIATHFNARGVADSWGSKWTLLFLPIICVGLSILLTIVGNHPEWHNRPGRMTMRQSRLLLSWVKLELVLIFGYMIWRTIQDSLGYLCGMGAWFLPTIIVIFLGTAVFSFLSTRIVQK